MVRWLFAAVHLIGFGVGLGSVWARGRVLRGPLDAAGLQRLFYADNWWGVSAILLIGSGLFRAFAGLEKGAAYYLHNHVFWGKMALLVLILILEIQPMIALVRWRILVRRNQPVDTRPAGRFAAISYAQATILLLMVLAATAMARGYGMGAR